MRPSLRSSFVLALAVAGSMTAVSGWADVTLHIHYTFVNGDTATRANYYSQQRMRATAPDGREYIYLASAKRITVIDHPTQTYWEGPMALADSIVDSLNAMRYRERMEGVTDEQKAEWAALVPALSDSVVVHRAWEHKEIAGYSCVRWTVLAGSWMTHDRWISDAIRVGKYPKEVQRVLLASVDDPLAKTFARILIDASETGGLPLAANTTFRTPGTSGSYSWETFRVDVAKIPESAWKAPAEYRRMTWADVRRKPKKT